MDNDIKKDIETVEEIMHRNAVKLLTQKNYPESGRVLTNGNFLIKALNAALVEIQELPESSP